MPEKDGEEFTRELYTSGTLPAVKLPDELQMEEARLTPKLHLKIDAPNRNGYDERLRGDFKFAYEDELIPAKTAGHAIVQNDRKRVIVRDKQAEANATPASPSARLARGILLRHAQRGTHARPEQARQGGRSARAPKGGMSKPMASSTASRANCASRSTPESTGLNCMAKCTSAIRSPGCRNCWPPCARESI